MKRDLSERFWEKVDKQPGDGCWLWTACTLKAGGYGAISINNVTCRAHRVAYELLIGPIPDGLVTDHLCLNPRCVRPDHLELVTQSENVRRITTRGYHHNAVKTHCPQGHEYTPDNTIIWAKRGWRYCRTCQDVIQKARKR